MERMSVVVLTTNALLIAVECPENNMVCENIFDLKFTNE